MASAEDIPFYLLFCVVMASLLSGIMIMVVQRQHEYSVDDQAQRLANDIARTCFSSLPANAPTYDLPTKVGGSEYGLRVENEMIIVSITAGIRQGMSYYSIVNAELEVRSLPAPGGRLYAQGRSDRVIVSAQPIEAPPWELGPPREPIPPAFYYWSRGREREAVAIAAAYFYALGRYPQTSEGGSLDVLAYLSEGDSVKARIGYSPGGQFVACAKATLSFDNSRVGDVESSWVVSSVEEIAGDIAGSTNPSVSEAAISGWLYSPSGVLKHLRQRTWRLGDEVFAMPGDASCLAAAVRVGERQHCAYLIRFIKGQEVKVFFTMLATDPGETQPGFTFASDPRIEPVI